MGHSPCSVARSGLNRQHCADQPFTLLKNHTTQKAVSNPEVRLGSTRKSQLEMNSIAVHTWLRGALGLSHIRLWHVGLVMAVRGTCSTADQG